MKKASFIVFGFLLIFVAILATLNKNQSFARSHISHDFLCINVGALTDKQCHLRSRRHGCSQDYNAKCFDPTGLDLEKICVSGQLIHKPCTDAVCVACVRSEPVAKCGLKTALRRYNVCQTNGSVLFQPCADGWVACDTIMYKIYSAVDASRDFVLESEDGSTVCDGVGGCPMCPTEFNPGSTKPRAQCDS